MNAGERNTTANVYIPKWVIRRQDDAFVCKGFSITVEFEQFWKRFILFHSSGAAENCFQLAHCFKWCAEGRNIFYLLLFTEMISQTWSHRADVARMHFETTGKYYNKRNTQEVEHFGGFWWRFIAFEFPYLNPT